MPFLSAAMIVKDEERFLGDCLASIRPVVDEIVVADTGSIDRSREIALAHGARLIDFPWAGDFAAARNAALDQARGPWILYIDADERLAPVSREDLRTALEDPTLIAGLVWFRVKTGYTLYREYRLFRNDPRIRFRGMIHEKVTPDIDRMVEQEGLRVADIELLLEHVGYDGAQEHKHRRNLPLLRAQLRQDPDNIYNWHHLGRVLEGLGDSEGAREAWLRSIGIVRRRGVGRPWDWLAYAELIRTSLPDVAATRALHDEAAALFPPNPQLRYLGGQIALHAGEHEAALAIFTQLAATDADTYFDRRVAYDKRLFGEFASAGIAACHFKRGEYAESAAWFAKAAAANPDSLEYRTKQLLAASREVG